MNDKPVTPNLDAMGERLRSDLVGQDRIIAELREINVALLAACKAALLDLEPGPMHNVVDRSGVVAAADKLVDEVVKLKRDLKEALNTCGSRLKAARIIEAERDQLRAAADKLAEACKPSIGPDLSMVDLPRLFRTRDEYLALRNRQAPSE